MGSFKQHQQAVEQFKCSEHKGSLTWLIITNISLDKQCGDSTIGSSKTTLQSFDVLTWFEMGTVDLHSTEGMPEVL